MDTKWFDLILAVIPVLATIITVFIVPYLKSKINSEKLAQYEEWGHMAVQAAEMLWSESGKGKDKKAYVVEFLNNLINKNKTVITDAQLNVLIESAVKQFKICTEPDK